MYCKSPTQNVWQKCLYKQDSQVDSFSTHEPVLTATQVKPSYWSLTVLYANWFTLENLTLNIFLPSFLKRVVRKVFSARVEAECHSLKGNE